MNSNLKNVKLKIEGISCINCCNKIEKALSEKEGILSVNVSYKAQTADICFNSEFISQDEISDIILEAGYEVSSDNKDTFSAAKRNAVILMVVILLFVLLQKSGILNLLAPGDLADSGMSLWVLFITGMITSVHCVAMCGGINLSQCISQNNNSDKRGNFSAFVPSLQYNMGRVISYTVIGCLMGLIGFVFGGDSSGIIPIMLQGAVKITAGILMVIMGINMLGIAPRLRGVIPKMPKKIMKKINSEKTRRKQPFIVGLLNGLMPCGPLYSMQLVALASADPIVGGLSMLMFSLGTVPLMLCFGSIVSVLGKKFSKITMAAGAVLVSVMGLAMVSQGGNLSGAVSDDMILITAIALSVVAVVTSVKFKRKFFRYSVIIAMFAVICIGIASYKFCGISIMSSENTLEGNAVIVDGVQVISSTLQSGSYPDINVQSGIPVKWIIDAPQGSINGCNYSVIISDFGIKYDFHTGENIIEFTPESSGTFTYTCWMGMIKGNITVT